MSETDDENNEKIISTNKRKKRKKKIDMNEDPEHEEDDKTVKKRKKRSKTTKKLKIIKNIEEDVEEEKTKRKRKRKKKKETEEEDENASNNEENEVEAKSKKKKRKRRKKALSDDENEDVGDNGEKMEEEGEKKRKRRRKKKRKNEEDNENEENNEENEENDENNKRTKKKRKKRKKEENEEENEENNEENDENNENKSMKKKKKKKKKKENEEENEENDEENNEGIEENDENNKSVKKKKKKKKKQEDNEKNEEGGISFTNEEKIKFYTTAKKLIKKKKKKKKADDNELEEQFRKTAPTIGNKLKSTKKRVNNLKTNQIKNDQNENEELEEKNNDKNEEDNDISEDENDNNDLIISEDNWPSIKKEFLTTYEAFINQISLYEHIDLALVSTICLSKKEFGNFKLTKHHEIYPIKNFNNINWAKEPYKKIEDKFYELIAPGQLLAKNNKVDFSNRIANEYEIYTAKCTLIKISGNDITENVEPENFVLSPENIEKVPHLLLLFSLDNEKSIILYKEILDYSKQNKDKFVFFPIYAPLINAPKNIKYVTEMLYRYNVYEKGDSFEICFSANDGLNKRFKYISEDNKNTITCKTVFLDVINNQFVVRAIRDLDSFTFNLIDKEYMVDKNRHQEIKKNLEIFKKEAKKKLKNTPLKEPFNCNWILRKVKIYTFPIKDKKMELKYTLYDPLTGGTNCHNLYKAEKEDYQKLCEILKDLGNYKLRSNPKKFSLTHKQKNDLVIEEMKKCMEKDEKLKNVEYYSIFQTQKIIMSLGPGLINRLKFEPIKTKSFKLEVHIDYKLFSELNPMNIIGSLYGLTLFSYFNNCDYIACLPKIGETFPNTLKLTNNQTLEDEEVPLNPSFSKPTLLIIFSLSFQNYFASNELKSRFKPITKKLENFIEKKNIDLILIYRGEPSKFSERFEQIKDEPIFDYNFPLYIQSSADLNFPLMYQNNDIESTDSQIMAYILSKNNKLVYTGNLEDIELDKTFQKLCENKTDNINDYLVYKEHANLPYTEFKEMIKPTMKQIEEIIVKEIKKDNILLYRPFFSLSYNTYTKFNDENTDNKKYVNHIRLRILVKERHINIFTQNKDFKRIITELKTYGASTIIVGIECEEDFDFEKECSDCHKTITDINENEPIYFDEESRKIFCENCGEKFSKDIKNDTYVTFFNTKQYKDEVISEIYQGYNKRNVTINPVLGNTCKICHNIIGDVYYLNLTNFNIDYIESPLIPIDICEICFESMRKGDPFLSEPLKRLNYEKLGLDYKQMIYRKIHIPISQSFMYVP